jgi:hypothetical protein
LQTKELNGLFLLFALTAKLVVPRREPSARWITLAWYRKDAETLTKWDPKGDQGSSFSSHDSRTVLYKSGVLSGMMCISLLLLDEKNNL